MKKWIACSSLALLLFTTVYVADFETGLIAYELKEYKAAFTEFLPLARKGHADAQFYLGWMYEDGENVKQN